MDSLVERAAAAAADSLNGAMPGWHYDQAEAMLAAIRDPTEAMLVAALQGRPDTRAARRDVRKLWRTMVSAALKAGDADGVTWRGLDLQARRCICADAPSAGD